MRLKEMHDCHSRGFTRTSYEITKQRNVRMLCGKFRLRTKLWDTIGVWKSTFWSHTLIFSRKSRRSDWRTRWKISPRHYSYGKAVPRQVDLKFFWQTIAGHWRLMYRKPNTGENHKPLHFSGKFLPVSLTRKALFCTFKFFCIFDTLPDRKILYTYMNSA